MRIPGALTFFVTAVSLAAQIHLPGTGGGAPKTPKPAGQSSSAPAASAPASAPAAKKTPPGTAGSFDYYLLSLSWSPNFCADPSKAAANPRECATGKNITFAVHGLWPESNDGANPENCAGSKSVPGGIVKSMLPYMFSADLVRHEWATHGTCSGLDQKAYFTGILQARTSVQIPVQITSLDAETAESPAQIEQQFEGANTGFPAGAFRIDCKSGALAEVRVCFDKNLNPQQCAKSAGECTDAVVRVLPVR
ncbi:MAG: ribonuclease T2 [Acidobacteriota bacterium]|nr:ribonuclease T2 [Acidobacteriota bacterium]